MTNITSFEDPQWKQPKCKVRRLPKPGKLTHMGNRGRPINWYSWDYASIFEELWEDLWPFFFVLTTRYGETSCGTNGGNHLRGWIIQSFNYSIRSLHRVLFPSPFASIWRAETKASVRQNHWRGSGWVMAFWDGEMAEILGGLQNIDEYKFYYNWLSNAYW